MPSARPSTQQNYENHDRWRSSTQGSPRTSVGIDNDIRAALPRSSPSRSVNIGALPSMRADDGLSYGSSGTAYELPPFFPSDPHGSMPEVREFLRSLQASQHRIEEMLHKWTDRLEECTEERLVPYVAKVEQMLNKLTAAQNPTCMKADCRVSNARATFLIPPVQEEPELSEKNSTRSAFGGMTSEAFEESSYLKESTNHSKDSTYLKKDTEQYKKVTIHSDPPPAEWMQPDMSDDDSVTNSRSASKFSKSSRKSSAKKSTWSESSKLSKATRSLTLELSQLASTPCRRHSERTTLPFHHEYLESKQCSAFPVLHPGGRFVNWVWQPLFFLAIAWALAMAPFDMAFHWWKPPTVYSVLGKIIDVFFILDVLMHFNIGIIHHGHLVSDRKKIAEHYLKTWLVLDIVSNTPYDWFIGSEGKSRKLVKIAKIPKLLRLIRLVRALKKQTQYIGVSLTMWGVCMAAHWFSCLWAWAMQGDCDEDRNECPNVGDAYVEGLSVAMSGMAGADSWTRLIGPTGSSVLLKGRQPYQRFDANQDLLAVCMTTMGLMITATLFANTSAAIMRRSEVGRRRSLMLETRRHEMKLKKIPKVLQEKVEVTYNYVWQFGGERDGMLRDPMLSLDLRRNLALCVYGKALQKVPLFSKVQEMYLKCLAQRVEMRLYTPGDLLMMKGEVGTELFIVHTGSVMPIDDDGEPLIPEPLTVGAFLGELCFLHPGARRQASVVCIEFCRALVLTIKVFEELNLSSILDELRQEAQKWAGTLLRSGPKTNRAFVEEDGDRSTLVGRDMSVIS